MKNIIRLSGVSFILAISSISYAATPEGNWRTYDLAQKPRSIVKLSQSGNQLNGRIIRVLSSSQKICSACRGKLHNRSLVGLPIIWGLKKENGQWVNGHVLNVDTGKTYQCNLKVSDNNQTLYFTAYVGVPMLGKTLNWERVR